MSMNFSVKGLAKRIFCFLIYYSRIEALLKMIMGGNKAVIIMFHSVNEINFLPSKSNFSIPVNEFRRKIRFYNRYNIVSLDYLFDMFQEGINIPRYTIAITFDDGYRDNLINAYPILKKYEMPFTIFLTSGYIGSLRYLPLNMIYYFISKTNKTKISVRDYQNEIEIICNLSTERDKDLAKMSIAKIYKGLASNYRENFLTELYKELDVDININYPECLMMLDQKDILTMCKDENVSFGSHTESHLILSKAKDFEARNEVRRSKEDIERIIGKSIKHFAYPNGHLEDFSERDKLYLLEAGYDSACTTIEGGNDMTHGLDQFALKRISWKTPNDVFAVKYILDRWIN